MTRKAKYKLTAGTKVWVSPAAVTAIPAPGAIEPEEMLKISTTAKELSFTGGQRTDIDVTVIESEETETINGLRAQSEFSISGNWDDEDEGQNSLRAADTTDTWRLMVIEFKNGSRVLLLIEVRQETWSLSPNGVASGSFNLRLLESPIYIPSNGSGGGGGGGGGQEGG